MPIRERDELSEIKVKTVYNGNIMITYINPHLTYDQLRQEMRSICRFPPEQVFTMKWVDEEGDPCVISSQIELETAIRLYEINKEPEITIHAMAWGYWSAATVSDRARSPRRHTHGSFANVSHFPASLPPVSAIPPPPPAAVAPAFHRSGHPIYGHVQPPTATASIAAHHQHHHHHQQQPHHQHQLQAAAACYNHHGSAMGSGSDDDYPPVAVGLSRRPSFADIEFTGPVPAGRPLTLLLEGAALSRPPSALNTFPRSYHHHHHQGGPDARSSGRSVTAATSTNALYAARGSVRRGECYVHSQQQPPALHHPQCHVHRKDYPSDDDDDDDEPDPAYATVFPNEPPAPGMTCQGEDRSIYRRNARRWRTQYHINGHTLVAKRLGRRAFCAYCRDRIWGLGRQGLRCIHCKLLIHKKCHKWIEKPCSNEPVELFPREDPANGVPSTATTPSPELPSERGDTTEPIEHSLGSIPVGVHSDENLEPGTQRQYSLNDFELIRVIGRGSYAKVLMVELKTTKRIYAMKVIKKALVTDDEDIDWVQTEKHVFETASNHPFLVGLHSCFQTPSRLFFVIEFVRGGDLMFHMQRQRRLPEDHARFYSAEISLALNFLHEKGVIYRDLKLDNVLLDHDGHIKLTDYGMCKEGIRLGDTTTTFCGTPNYIAPEILRGEDYGFSVDWWALGVLLYEMLAGRSPFDIAGAPDNPDNQHEDYLFQVILEKPIRIPRSLSVKASSVLKGFLNKNPAERLGCSPATGFIDIVEHPFFKSIDWESLQKRQMPTPYRPRLECDRDLANFPPEFTDEPVLLTPDDERVISRIDQSEFEGFEYVNPLLMSLEDCV